MSQMRIVFANNQETSKRIYIIYSLYFRLTELRNVDELTWTWSYLVVNARLVLKFLHVVSKMDLRSFC